MKFLTLIDKAFLLKRTGPFSFLDLDLLLTIADKLTLVVFFPNDAIFSAGEEANRMYFIVKGRVQVVDEAQNSLFQLETGDFFGDEALFNNSHRAYSTNAIVETHTLALSRTNLYTILSECPSVAVGFLQVYATLLPLRPPKDKETDK